MTQLKLRSGFTFDVTNLYGPNAVTEDEVKAFAPVYTKAHEAVMNMRKTGIMPGHLSKDGEPEEVLFPQLPYIEDGNINSPERIFALEELARTTRNRVDAVVFLGIGGSYLRRPVRRILEPQEHGRTQGLPESLLCRQQRRFP